MSVRHRIELLLILLGLLSAGAYVLRKAAWADGPPPSSLVSNHNIEKVIVHWDKQKAEIVDEPRVQQFYQAVISGSDPLPYSTRCLADQKPENWSVTFIRSGQAPFQIQLGLDGCGSYYIPEVRSTYKSAALLPLVKQTLKIR